MAGYISLFFDDARMQLPQEKMTAAKEAIFSNYKKVFPAPDPTEQYDLQSFLENDFLKEMESQLQKGNKLGEAKKTNLIRYWDLNIGTAISTLKKDLSLTDQIKETLNYIESCQNILSEAINASDGVISTSLIQNIKDRKQTLENISNKIKTVTTKETFKSLFFGSLIGTIANAQGVIHELAGLIAAQEAKKVAEKALHEKNQELNLLVESTGGKLTEDSTLEEALKKSNLDLGLTNNAKNDITIAVKDGNGKIIWSTGLSLKSTSAATPNLVKIMEQDLTTLLNKVYSQEHYLNMAASLGKGDWSDRTVGIGAIAEKVNVITSSQAITEAWKDMIYTAIYLQIIDMFAGKGGVLNNAQYLVINSKPIAMRDIFDKLSNKQNYNLSDSIQGIKISGARPAILRTDYTNANINGFIKDIDNNPLTTAEERILRSTSAWDNVYKKIQSHKIQISLKYRELYGMNPTK